MAKRVEGVTEKLLESAKKEFLKSGYENASLQVIAEKAGSSKYFHQMSRKKRL